MDYSQYIVSSASVQMTLTYKGVNYNIATGVQLSISISQDVNEIFGIGQLTPIGLKKLNQRFTGNLSLQTGEYETILDAINAGVNDGNFIASPLDLDRFSLGWAMSTEGVTPKTIIYSLDLCSINNSDYSLDRNSPETNTSFSLQGLGITRRVFLG